MPSRATIQDKLIRRAEQFAHERHYSGPGRFQVCDLKKSFAELSPEEKAIERSLAPRPDHPNQMIGAKNHLAEQIRMFTAQGHSPAAAIEKAIREEHPKLKERRAGFDPTISLDAGQKAMCKMFSVSEPPMKAYAAGSGVGETVTDAARTVGRDVLIRQVAASVLHRGNSAPDQYERSFADDWYGVHFPPPPPVSGGQDLGGYNTQRLAFVESVLADARRLLADPAARTQISPRPLNG